MRNDPKEKTNEQEQDAQESKTNSNDTDDGIIPELSKDDLTFMKEGIDSPLLPDLD